MRSEEGEDGEDGDVDEVDAMEFREEGFGEESKMDEVGERLIKDVCVRGERVKGERPIMEAKKGRKRKGKLSFRALGFDRRRLSTRRPDPYF